MLAILPDSSNSKFAPVKDFNPVEMICEENISDESCNTLIAMAMVLLQKYVQYLGGLVFYLRQLQQITIPRKSILSRPSSSSSVPHKAGG